MSHQLYISVDGADASLFKILFASKTCKIHLKVIERKSHELEELAKTAHIPQSLAKKHVLVVEPLKLLLFEANAIIR
jgi:hypothetical protein